MKLQQLTSCNLKIQVNIIVDFVSGEINPEQKLRKNSNTN